MWERQSLVMSVSASPSKRRGCPYRSRQPPLERIAPRLHREAISDVRPASLPGLRAPREREGDLDRLRKAVHIPDPECEGVGAAVDRVAVAEDVGDDRDGAREHPLAQGVAEALVAGGVHDHLGPGEEVRVGIALEVARDLHRIPAVEGDSPRRADDRRSDPEEADRLEEGLEALDLPPIHAPPVVARAAEDDGGIDVLVEAGMEAVRVEDRGHDADGAGADAARAEHGRGDVGSDGPYLRRRPDRG